MRNYDRRSGAAGRSRVETGRGEAALPLDAAGRVTYANLAAAHLLGAESPLGLVGGDAARVLRDVGQGIAALALQSAAHAVGARATPDAASRATACAARRARRAP